jgi:hypothetical protein
MIRRFLLLLVTLVAPAVLAASADLAIGPQGPFRFPPDSLPFVLVRLDNLGPDPAMNIVVSASHPCADPCNFPTLLPDHPRYFGISLPKPLRPGQSYDIDVHLSSDTPDPDLSNNSTTVHVEISDAPNLFVYGWGDDDIRDPGLPFTLPLNFGNHAAFDAHDVIITADFDPRIQLTGGRGAPCTVAGTRITCTIGDIPARTERQDVVIEGVNPPLFDGGATLNYTMSIAGREPELQPFDNTFNSRVILRRTLLVTSADDGGDGTLRDAIDHANASCVASKECKIAFRLPPGTTALTNQSALPPLRASMIVDGDTQTRLDGRHVAISGSSGSGFVIEGCADVRGLDISGFPENGVTVNAPACGGSSILGCTIHGNERGVVIAAGPTTVRGNMIEGNRRSGVFGWSGGLVVDSNELRGNGASGVYTRIAGSSIMRNVISGNADFGIAIDRAAPYVDMDANRIFDNGQRGIDVGLDGRGSPLHTEPPILTRAVYDPMTGYTTVDGVMGRFHIDYSYVLRLQLFASTKADPRGAAETVLVTPPYYFPLQVKGDLTGQFITATQTVIDINGFARTPRPDAANEYATSETSELSEPIEVRR